MNQNKICPVCEAEYLPHIQKCADCDTALLLPEEHRNAKEEKKRLGKKNVEDTAVVREGDLNWMKELRAVLIDNGIPCTIYSDIGCKKGCCGDKCKLIVSSDDLERAEESIHEYFMELDPELRASNEWIKDGKCPACGSPVGKDMQECPDCELPLLIVEEEE